MKDEECAYMSKNFRCENSVFQQRQRKLARVLDLLHSDLGVTSIVHFDPAVPQTNMVHGYIKAPYDKCILALNTVEERTGIRVLSRLNECSSLDSTSSRCRFEWVMGEANSEIDDGVFVSGWNAFVNELLQLCEV